MSSSVDDSIVGKVLQHKYRVDGYLASGAMGAVYRGTQLAVHREVAIKVLKMPEDVEASERETMERRFAREARTTSQLQHPNSVRLFDYGETEGGNPYLVMELLRGKTLKGALRAAGKLEPWRVAHIARQICRALAEAHSMGIVHRDLKPDNVFLISLEGETDFVKVVDYGIARMALPDTDQVSVTRTGMAVGTPRYMAPEQALCKDVSPATDLYTLGVMLYEMLSGDVPFHGESAVAVAMKHVQEPAPALPPLGISPAVDQAWGALLQRMLAKRPEDRPSSAATVAAALDHLELRSREAKGVMSRTEDDISLILKPLEVADAADDTHLDTTMPLPASSASARRAAPLRRKMVAVGIAAFLGIAAVVAIVWAPSWRTAEGGEASEGARGGASEMSSAAEQEVEAPAPEEPAAAAVLPEAPEAVPVAEVASAEAPPVVPEPVVAEVPEPVPAEPTAHLALTSIPDGAEVVRAGELLCHTPCELDVPASTTGESLTVRLAGYEDHQVPVVLTEGSRVIEKVALERTAHKGHKTVARSKPSTKPAQQPEKEPKSTALPKLRIGGTEPASTLPKLRIGK